MDYNELVKNLRGECAYALPSQTRKALCEAADAIEELSKRVEFEHQSGFADGQIAARRKKPRWISVEERLPSEDGHYFVRVLCEADEVAVGWTQMAWFCRKFYWEHRGEEYEETITHWMPLPEPPKEEEP